MRSRQGSPRQHVLEVRGVRAVDHVVGGPGPRGRVDLGDRVAQLLTAREPPVGLEREGDHRRHARRRGRARDPDRLGRVGHRDRGDHVGGGVREGRDLDRVVLLRRVAVQDHGRVVAVVMGADAAADDDRRGVVVVLVAELLHQRDRPAVERVQLLGRVAEPLGPARVRAPRRALEDEPRAVIACERRVGLEVAPQRGRAGVVAAAVGNAANSGRSSPSWKISVVSMPPSVRNRPPSSCGRCDRSLTRAV